MIRTALPVGAGHAVERGAEQAQGGVGHPDAAVASGGSCVVCWRGGWVVHGVNVGRRPLERVGAVTKCEMDGRKCVSAVGMRVAGPVPSTISTVGSP